MSTTVRGVDLGTSIMAVTFNGGVVMGADSRTSTGSGSAADTQAISDIVRRNMEGHALSLGRLPRVLTAANMFQLQCYEKKEQAQAGIICAGWDEMEGGQVYSIPLGGALVRQPFAIAGSGSSYIYAYCDANYRHGMTMEECRTFVKNALSHAMSRDGSSGGVIRTVTITREGCVRDFTAGDQLPVLDSQIAF